MAIDKKHSVLAIQCPFCQSEAIYKYGHTHTGKQRYICIMCNRQFTLGVWRLKSSERPCCPECGRLMHVYKHDSNSLRFRCAGYPDCRSYTKTIIKKGASHELLHA